jgi:hypothetical protein
MQERNWCEKNISQKYYTKESNQKTINKQIILSIQTPYLGEDWAKMIKTYSLTLHGLYNTHVSKSFESEGPSSIGPQDMNMVFQ